MKMSDEDYFAHPFLSCSNLKKFIHSPKLFNYRQQHPIPFESKAFTEGSAVHMLSLEAELFDASYAVWDGDFRGSEFTQFKKKAKADGKDVLKKKDIAVYEEMASTLRAVLDLDAIPAEQKEFVAMTEIMGVGCRGKADFMTNDGYLVDIKTVGKNDLKTRIVIDEFGEEQTVVEWSDMFKYGYDLQACFYLLVFSKYKPKGFRFALIEKTAPYDVTVLDVSAEILERAKKIIKKALTEYKSCLDKDDWTSTNRKTLVLPSYLERT